MARVSGEQDSEGDLKRLGATIRACRTEQHLSQEALADASGIDRSHMGKIERGERNVTFLNMLRIARALETKPSAILQKASL
ncbi:helix-turn-helix domain-containing protein [Brevundimonas nasdae]|uniref:helix-turn-helix domain-containing protein n=1 Tax=Brevundimonas nasdae TaxID=172043 RepID=UPI003F692B62